MTTTSSPVDEDPLLPGYKWLKAMRDDAADEVTKAEAKLDARRRKIESSGTLRLTPGQIEDLADLEEDLGEARSFLRDTGAAFRLLIKPSQSVVDPGDPVAIRITAPLGANVRGKHWVAGSIVVADCLEGPTLINAGLASPPPDAYAARRPS